MRSRTRALPLSPHRAAEWRTLDQLADADGELAAETNVTRSSGGGVLAARATTFHIDRRELEASLTVCYGRTDAQVFTSRVGHGRNFKEALDDADAQLPVGTWRRLVVSSPESIMLDLRSDARGVALKRLQRRGERETVTVEKRVTVARAVRP